MANNKVQLSNGTVLIDLTDTTATASDVASGKYFYTAAGVKTEGTASGGGTPAISVVDTTDTHGGTIRTITAVDISDTTATASDVAQGKYFYTAQGVKTAGTGSGGTPSATAHTIYFEFSDNTNTTITAYYDDSFISNAITATNPPVYGSKTVVIAQLDGVTWYDANDIPMNTELIDYTKSSSNTMINERGQAVAEDWYYASDYTTVAAGMTFSYTASRWGYIGLYDENKTVVRVIDCSSDGTVDQSDSNLVHGTISGSQLTNVAYARLSGAGNNSYSMSLIRTA